MQQILLTCLQSNLKSMNLVKEKKKEIVKLVTVTRIAVRKGTLNSVLSETRTKRHYNKQNEYAIFGWPAAKTAFAVLCYI